MENQSFDKFKLTKYDFNYIIHKNKAIQFLAMIFSSKF